MGKKNNQSYVQKERKKYVDWDSDEYDKDSAESDEEMSESSSESSEEVKERKDDDWEDICYICNKDYGNVLCCEKCPKVCHYECTGLRVRPKDDWYCDRCRSTGNQTSNLRIQARSVVGRR